MTLHADPRAEAFKAPLRINDLVRDVDREPRIPDLTLAERLGFAKPHNVRKLIDRNRPELMLHGALVERSSGFLRGGENLRRGGRPGTMYFLNEGQALVVCALTRTPAAVKVRQDVIAVYMAHRRGGDWLPPAPRERAAIRHLVENGHVYPLDEPLEFRSDERGGWANGVLVSLVDRSIVTALATFEDADTFEGDDERDQDAGEEREHLNEDGEDVEGDDEPEAERSLGWSADIDQSSLNASRDDRERDAGDEPEAVNEDGDHDDREEDWR